MTTDLAAGFRSTSDPAVGDINSPSAAIWRTTDDEHRARKMAHGNSEVMATAHTMRFIHVRCAAEYDSANWSWLTADVLLDCVTVVSGVRVVSTTTELVEMTRTATRRTDTTVLELGVLSACVLDFRLRCWFCARSVFDTDELPVDDKRRLKST